MNITDIVQTNLHETLLFVVLAYSFLLMWLTKDTTVDKLSSMLVMMWLKLLSIVYIFNFPLIFFFSLRPGVNFDRVMMLFIGAYSITYIVLFVFGSLFTLEFMAKLVYYLTGYDLSSKLKIDKNILK